MKNLKKISRESLKSIQGGLRSCNDGCLGNTCCLESGVCGTPNGTTTFCKAPDSTGCAGGTFYCEWTMTCIQGNQLCVMP